MISLTIIAVDGERKTSHEKLTEIVDEVEALGERDDWSSNLVFRVSLVIEEQVQNVLDHAYADSQSAADGVIEVAITSRGDGVIIEIIDDGPPFDPLPEAPEPDLTSPVEERCVGGLGVYFIRTLMDEVVYSRDSGQNRLRMSTQKVK